nr:hypothetical protein [Streptomyces lavendulae]
MASGTAWLAAAMSLGTFQRSFVPTAGASGATSRRPVSASKPAATPCPVVNSHGNQAERTNPGSA